ncbi:recombinase family protein [Nonomuraea sp. SBT364]|uniref:recombinase family protein n=1 Tax=Nonomuraea sp. SBT364 TaxID=1580530 RepID=UPI000A69BFC7|nr:recombinase family protein [Nonomuraea sp. SBT364]
MLFGYARVSTADQNPTTRSTRCCARALTVMPSIWTRPAAPKLKVTRLDRLSRSVLHLVTLGADLRERGVGRHVIEQGIDTDTMEGRAMFGMLSVLAELQRELIVANTMDGLASARARGRVGGRRPKLTADQAALAQQLYDTRDKPVQQIADLFGVARSTMYGHLKGDTMPRQPKKTSDRV